ncbi:MAG: glycoside hydrolase family 38 C-terminal domain-containing protein [Anaerolineae bacterium]|jgi:alpha-mannosidase
MSTTDRVRPPHTLHIVSHTHWDREWYRTYQQFRFRLVALVDTLLEILEQEPDYRFLTLDGQAIILEDVVDLRPDLAAPLHHHIRAGRILIGPWYVLPDEFLVSPEALVRNLLLGEQACRQWGARMDIGYVPDPFGHISQLPQLLRGFGIDTACFSRGAGAAPTEFRWAAPDGTEVLVCFLRDHYDNVAHLPREPERMTQALADARDSLAPHAASSHLLMMQGTDHLVPRPDLPGLLAQADDRLPDRVVHSTLPNYVAAVRDELGRSGLAALPQRSGELRDPSRRHLLPGVLSARMGIKQRNHACQTLLERWAEPFAALANLVGPRAQPSLAAGTRRAWRYLLENHPHDSICGCSVDQVHREMETRFDWCEQLGQEVTRAAVRSLTAEIDTGDSGLPALAVFNPGSAPRTDRVVAQVAPPVDPQGVTLLDPDGTPIPFRVMRHTWQAERSMTLDRHTMAQMAAQAEVSGGRVWGEWQILSLQVWREHDAAHVAVAITRGFGLTGIALPEQQVAELKALLDDPEITTYQVHMREDAALEVAFVAREVPPLGYTTYRFVPATESAPQQVTTAPAEKPPTIETERFRVSADPETGHLTVIDRETGLTLPRCHRLVDSGDRGDEYNYCPPAEDPHITHPIAPPVIRRTADAVGQQLVIEATYQVPRALAPDRSARAAEMVDLPITTSVTLTPEVDRIDFETTVENHARDHRLRIHFPTPLAVDTATAAGHWDAVEWSLTLPQDTEGWIEQPVPTRPQRGWVTVSDGSRGVTLANRGLPEVEVIPTADGSEIALTLLRCVGWLSRDDFPCRDGPAGPKIATPEAQCPGRYIFRYALIPHAGGWPTALSEAEAFQADLLAVSAGSHPGSLPPALSFLSVRPESLRVSTVKPPQEGQGLVVRVWNAAGKPVQGTLRLWRPFHRAVRTNLAEQTEEELTRNASSVTLSLHSREVVTLRFTYSDTGDHR